MLQYNIYKKAFLILFLLILCSCANWEFVYSNHSLDKLKDKTTLNFINNNSYALSYLTKLVGEEKKNADFELTINLQENITNIITKNNQTANTIQIEYLIYYTLKNNNEKCEILNKQILTKSSYNSKSSGYSFGSDVAKNDAEETAIKQNINIFIEYIDAFYGELKC
jgi:hypothetical protein